MRLTEGERVMLITIVTVVLVICLLPGVGDMRLTGEAINRGTILVTIVMSVIWLLIGVVKFIKAKRAKEKDQSKDQSIVATWMIIGAATVIAIALIAKPFLIG